MPESLGYRVSLVTDVRSAATLVESGERIDLVLSDVVLPGGMSGAEFATWANQHSLGLKVILMSGYPAAARGARELSASSTDFARSP